MKKDINEKAIDWAAECTISPRDKYDLGLISYHKGYLAASEEIARLQNNLLELQKLHHEMGMKLKITLKMLLEHELSTDFNDALSTLKILEDLFGDELFKK